MERCGDGVGGLGRLAPAQFLGLGALLAEIGVLGDAEQPHGTVLEVAGTAGVERLVVGLGVGLERDQTAEHLVDPADHRLGRTEVGAQRRLLGADLVGGAQVLGDVGSPEPVDRLLRVADDEQPAGERLRALVQSAAWAGSSGSAASRTAISSWIGSVSWNSSSSSRW